MSAQAGTTDATTAQAGVAPPDVSIIVVSYCTREMTLACLASIIAQTRVVDYEVIVVDNASTDGSAEAIAGAFPQFKLIASQANLGFAVANNHAAQFARGEYILLLNPDTVVLDGAIDKLVAFARRRPEAGIWGGRTLYGDGRLNSTSCWGRMTPWSVTCFALGLTKLFRNSMVFNPEAMGTWQRDTVRRVDIVTGCFFLMGRQLWRQLGGFDPTYFMYGEEADLCLRAYEKGTKPLIDPSAAIVHYGSASDTSTSEKRVKVYTGKVTLMRLHWNPVLAAIGIQTLLMACLMRSFAFGLYGRLFRRPDAVSLGRNWHDTWLQRARWTPGYKRVQNPSTAYPVAG
jgi:hypothetical protein